MLHIQQKKRNERTNEENENNICHNRMYGCNICCRVRVNEMKKLNIVWSSTTSSSSTTSMFCPHHVTAFIILPPSSLVDRLFCCKTWATLLTHHRRCCMHIFGGVRFGQSSDLDLTLFSKRHTSLSFKRASQLLFPLLLLLSRVEESD